MFFGIWILFSLRGRGLNLRKSGLTSSAREVAPSPLKIVRSRAAHPLQRFKRWHCVRFYFTRLRSCLKRVSTHESLESRFLILKAFLDFTILRGIVNNSLLFLSLLCGIL